LCFHFFQCTAQNNKEGVYIIKKGDTVYKITKRFDISQDSLVSLNSHDKKLVKALEKGPIIPGMKIRVPVSSKEPFPPETPVTQKPNPKSTNNPDVGKPTIDKEPNPTISSRMINYKTNLGKRYQYIVFDPKDYEVELFNKMERGRGVHDFRSIHDLKRRQNEELVFAMNAGMYDERRQPIGLYISEGREEHPINLRKQGYGNFFSLPPNGVFAMDFKNNPYLMVSNDFEKEQSKTKFKLATQSGPMLVIDGKFNKAFNEGSPNLNIRNGVGITKNNEVVFVVSAQPVNFYEFSQFFRDVLGCDNALYLDGVISQSYPKSNTMFYQQDVPLGPIICVSEKKRR
jgi:uncharacterized protein YigE (DUF2233 family)